MMLWSRDHTWGTTGIDLEGDEWLQELMKAFSEISLRLLKR